MARKPDNPELARFAALLARHMTDGTRPATASGEPWTDVALAEEVISSRENEYVSPRTVSNWRNGRSLPEEIEPLTRALFGSGDRHATARDALRVGFVAARSAKLALITARAKRDPAGGTWVIEDNERLALDRSVRTTDQRAAVDSLRQQLQSRIRDMAADLIEPAKRLNNSRTWERLSKTVEALHAILDCPPVAVTERLGDAYALMLSLGGFLETDIRVQRDPAAMDEPLDPDIHGMLTDLVRTAAPWLRGFPTVAGWDDAAGKALVRADLFQSAREFTRISRERETISERDAAEMEVLADAARSEGFQGQKAGNRAVADTHNLLIALANVLAGFAAGSGTSRLSRISPLVRRAGATLAAADKQVDAFAVRLPGDLRQALRTLVEEGQKLGRSTSPVDPPALPDLEDLPFNRNLLRKVEELEFSVRTDGGLKRDHIVYIGDLVQRSEQEMLRIPNIGRKPLNEIKEVLASMGLGLGMSVAGWPPENIEELRRYLNEPVSLVEPPAPPDLNNLPFNRNFLRKVDELEFSARTDRYLKNDNIVYIGDLVQKTEQEVRQRASLGRKILIEIGKVLAAMGLSLGMTVPGWPPENIEELAKKLESF
jgi:hypothetical protein